jgi:hypothetical protein
MGDDLEEGVVGGRGAFVYSDKLTGRGIERSKYMWVLSSFLQSKSVHKDDREMNTSLQSRHTWVSVIMYWSLSQCLSQKSGMRARISGGIRLTGASLFLRDRIRRRISKTSCSRTSNYNVPRVSHNPRIQFVRSFYLGVIWGGRGPTNSKFSPTRRISQLQTHLALTVTSCRNCFGCAEVLKDREAPIGCGGSMQ